MHQLWQPKNCNCGRCMKLSSSIQRKCCEQAQCITEDGGFMKKLLENAEKTWEDLPDLQLQLEWYVRNMYDRDRLIASMRRSSAYKAYSKQRESEGHPPDEEKGESIPRCVIRRIRKEFPDKKGKYTGFNTSHTLADSFKAFCQETDKDESEFKVLETEKKVLTRLPRMGIFTTTVSFESFVIGAMRLAVDAVCYRLGQVNEKDFVNFLQKALDDGTLTNEDGVEVKYLKYLSGCDTVPWTKQKASVAGEKGQHERKIVSLKGSAEWQWVNIRAKLKSNLPNSEDEHAISNANFLQSLIDEKKKNVVELSKPVLCDIMHCLRNILKAAWGKDKSEKQSLHSMCICCTSAADCESEMVCKLLTHIIKESESFELFGSSSESVSDTENFGSVLKPKVETAKGTECEQNDAQIEAPCGDSDTTPAADRGIKINLENVEALCHVSCLMYGIRCLYCHGDGDKTVEEGVLTDSNCSADKLLLKADSEDEAEQARKYLKELRNEARKKKTKLEANRFMYLNIVSFYKYFAKVLAKACICLVYYCNERKIVFGDTYWNKSFSDQLADFSRTEILEAIRAMGQSIQSSNR